MEVQRVPADEVEDAGSYVSDFFFQWFAQRARGGVVFQWSAQRVCGVGVGCFQWSAQRGDSDFFFNGLPGSAG